MKKLKEDREYLKNAYCKMIEAINELGQVIDRTDQIWDMIDRLDSEINELREILIDTTEQIIEES